jgi:hypothetical protein
MTVIFFMLACLFTVSPMMAEESDKLEESGNIDWVPLSDGHVLIACEEGLYSIVKLESHYYVVKIIDHSPSCPCECKEPTSK